MATARSIHNIYYKIVGFRTFCPRLTGQQASRAGRAEARSPLSHVAVNHIPAEYEARMSVVLFQDGDGCAVERVA